MREGGKETKRNKRIGTNDEAEGVEKPPSRIENQNPERSQTKGHDSRRILPPNGVLAYPPDQSPLGERSSGAHDPCLKQGSFFPMAEERLVFTLTEWPLGDGNALADLCRKSVSSFSLSLSLRIQTGVVHTEEIKDSDDLSAHLSRAGWGIRVEKSGVSSLEFNL